MTRSPVLLTLLLAGALPPAAAPGPFASRPGAPDPVPTCRLDVRIEPAAGTLEATADFRATGASLEPVFALSRDLTVRRLQVDGRDVAFREGTPSPEGIREVSATAPAAHRLRIDYGGRIDPASYPRILSQVNGIGPERVELASYVGWVPRLKAAGSFEFELAVDLPAGFVAVTNGRAVRPARPAHGRTRGEWRSYGPVSDILLLAAPGLRRVAAAGGGTVVELYASTLPAEYLEAMKDDVAAAVGLLSRFAGSPAPTGIVRVAWAPRAGWGYVRTPLIVVSERSALALSTERFGRARDLRYIAHEVAHYWWHLADAATPEDWLNEGLAEYSALLVADSLVGREFRDTLLREYRERAAASPQTSAILETENGSPDREINRYVRPVLMLEGARDRYGAARMAAFLGALHARFVADGRATTPAFLEVAERVFGPEARDDVRLTLQRRGEAGAARPAYAYVAADSVFLGTWAGALTQAGTTTRVVLHLALRAGALVATTDSPDQGVAGIPVPTVRIAGDTLAFALGNFGVAYRGTRAAGGTVIRGVWTQGGSAVPLVLTRSAADGTVP